ISGKILKYASNEIRSNYEFMIKAISLDFELLTFCPDEMKEDIQFWISFLKTSKWLFQYIPEKFRENFELAALAVDAYPMNLEFASNEVKNSKKIVMKPTLDNPIAFQHASSELRSDVEFIRILLSKGCSRCVKYCESEVFHNKKFMLGAISQWN